MGRQWRHVCQCLAVFPHSKQGLSLEMVPPTLKVSSHLLSYLTFKVGLNQIKQNPSLACPTVQPNLHSCSLRASSQVCLDCVKLTLKANHHTRYQVPNARDKATWQLQSTHPTLSGITTNRGLAWLDSHTVCVSRASHLFIYVSPFHSALRLQDFCALLWEP